MRFSTRYCLDDAGVLFKPHQPFDVISLRESLDETVLVLPDTFDEVGRDANVDRAIGFGGKEST